ncbi:MAG TPA: DUF6702 family protein [Puia sp.]|nr:DUF6702 family protein [Puia sp.]
MVTSLVKWTIAAIYLGLSAGSANGVPSRHPFYVSVTDINHNARDKTLEISCKIFANDFEISLAKISSEKIDLNNSKNKPENDKMISQYLIRHLQIVVNGQARHLLFVGSENKSGSVWSYFEVDNIPIIKKIEIKNDVLYESFPSEINIIHVTVGGTRKSLEIANPNNIADFEFE